MDYNGQYLPQGKAEFQLWEWNVVSVLRFDLTIYKSCLNLSSESDLIYTQHLNTGAHFTKMV